MTGLCIDTSGKMLTMALWEEGQVLAAHSEPALQRHSDLMTRVMLSLLEGRGLSVKDIGAIAVTNGPGSFTGLRVGIAYAKGLAMGLGAKLIALNTLEAMAWSLEVKVGKASPMLDAKRKQVYAALYDMRDGVPAAMSEPVAADPAEWLVGLPDGTAVFGSGLAEYRALAEGHAGRLHLQERPEEPTPEGLVRMTLAHLRGRGFIGVEELDAFYIRKADAELKAGKT